MSGETIVTTSWWERYSADVAARETHRLDVFFRSLAPSQGTHDKRNRVLARIEDLDSGNVIDRYDINVVGDGICLCEECAETRLGRHIHETLTALREGSSGLKPQGFRERSVDSSMTGEQYRLLEPPEMSLAVYVDSELRGVFPAAVDGRTVTIPEFLNALATLDATPLSARAQA